MDTVLKIIFMLILPILTLGISFTIYSLMKILAAKTDRYVVITREHNTRSLITLIDTLIEVEVSATLTSKTVMEKMINVSMADNYQKTLIELILAALPIDIISDGKTFFTEASIYEYIRRRVFYIVTEAFDKYNENYRVVDHPGAPKPDIVHRF